VTKQKALNKRLNLKLNIYRFIYNVYPNFYSMSWLGRGKYKDDVDNFIDDIIKEIEND